MAENGREFMMNSCPTKVELGDCSVATTETLPVIYLSDIIFIRLPTPCLLKFLKKYTSNVACTVRLTPFIY